MVNIFYYLIIIMKYNYINYCKIKKCNRCTINGIYCFKHWNQYKKYAS